VIMHSEIARRSEATPARSGASGGRAARSSA
jgi:hypothetical protein